MNKRMTLLKTELKQDAKSIFATVTVRDENGIDHQFVAGCFYLFLKKLPTAGRSASADKICIMCGNPFTESKRAGTTIACAKCRYSCRKKNGRP